ncbi:LCP family protein, partial [Pseudonocardia spirodelae]
RRRRALRLGAAAAAVLVLLTSAFGFAGRSQVYDGVRDVAALSPDADAILDADSQAGDRNVLVLGLQADRTGAAESARTDTAVLVHQPAGGGPAVTLSIPATLEVSRPPCRSWDAATGGYGPTVPAESRIAFATAYDVGGPACSVGVAQQLTGIPVTGFVALDLARAPELVGAVGGIEVCTERPVVDPVLGPVVEGAGAVALDGPTAVRFASASGTADSSPANRIQRQQRVLAAALGDALSTGGLLTPGAPGRAADGVSAALAADGVDAGEILTLARGLGRAGTAGDGSTPVFLPVPVADAPNTRGHLELRRSEARELFGALREHEPLPASATAPAARSAATPAPGTVVDLVDATGRPGAVDRFAADLRERGYEIGTVTPGPVATGAQVRYSPDRTDAAGTLVDALPGVRPAPDPTGTGTLALVVGAGDAGPVQAVATDGTDCS